MSARVLIAEARALVRIGLATLIGRAGDLVVCGEVAEAGDLFQAVAEHEPDLVTLDVAAQAGGLDLVRDLRRRYADLPLLVVSAQDEVVYAERTLRAGANGFVTQDEDPEELLSAVRRVLAGEVYLRAELMSRVVYRAAGREELAPGRELERLSDRELEVYELIGEGLGPSAIAERLHLSVKTIETHRARLKRKLNVASSSELLRHALTQHLLCAESPVGLPVEPASRGPDPHDRPPPSLGDARPWLVGQDLGVRLSLADHDRCLIGRGPDATLRLESTLVSRSHAVVIQTPPGRLLLDLGSSNGTFVNGYRLRSPCLLHDGDQVSCADVQLTFRKLADGSTPRLTPPETGSTRRLVLGGSARGA